MSEGSKSLRIDWFDGTVIEETRPSPSFADEDAVDSSTPAQIVDKKAIGFKRLMDISLLPSPQLSIEISHRPGFWFLFDTDLKGDFIVLIVKILASVYKDLKSDEKSKLAKMLKTKLESSIFLSTLKKYLIGLPNTRINDKNYNSQFWIDVEIFYGYVLEFCEGVISFGGHKQEFVSEIYDLLDVLETSMVGVIEEHMEKICEDLFAKLNEIKAKAANIVNNSVSHSINNTTEDKPKDPNYFKNMTIFPNKDDLLGKRNLIIQPNLVNGAYPSIQHYLDLQFKLLREDYIGPLREGINKYMENPNKRRHENIRVHPKVRIIRTYVSNNKVGHLIDIAWSERSSNLTVDMKKLTSNKQLMFGSMLLFTSDNFETILIATVLDSSMSLLSEGYVAVSFQSPVSNRILSEQYLMVESEVFFEPYHRVLKVLQDSRTDELPMSQYIVDVQTSLRPPAYLTSETFYNIKGQDLKEISFPILKSDHWPHDSFGLDDAQLTAFKFALTKEFAVIQGPPGTGKTFIGVKIASTILQNLSLEGTPMLVICYTNHALDQFLEGILNVTNNVVRLGSQSKSKVLEPYTLFNLRTNLKSKYSQLYAKKRRELGKIFKEMTDVQSEIELCEKEILSYKSVKRYLKLEYSKEDPVLDWLFGHLEEKDDDSKFEFDDWEKFNESQVNIDELNIDVKVDSCFSEEWGLREIDSMLKSMEYVKDVAKRTEDIEAMNEKFDVQIKKVRRRLNCLKKYKSLSKDVKQDDFKQQTTDLYSLSPELRWIVYYRAVNQVKEDLQMKINDLVQQHNSCSDELSEVTTLIDGEVLKTVRVVGVTTTTAARRHDLLKKLLSPIVIVEEAAEVFEAHIVASLTKHCQHLILIGDHKQLRPTAAHYKLAKDYNLEVSLFERMIQNGVHARTLTTQRRMRPNFVELLVPAIYNRLDCHPIVSSYPDVVGMRDSLYFFSHDSMEDSEGHEDSWSHRNTLEAKWCVSLAKYLRGVGYKREEITVLATYTGQASLIKQLSKGIEMLRDVKMTVVDNYQGEENRIVILSLVRGNRDNKIGFLNAANRICVALSRAKEGFYIFGNMNVLKSSSTIWRQINDKLISMNAIGQTFSLRCDKHKENFIEINKIEEFEDCLSGSCLKVCEINSRFVHML